MRQVLEGLSSGQFSWHLLLLIFLVFIATPILKHMLFKRGRGGSVYQPPRNERWTPGQVRQARKLLDEQRRKQGGTPPSED